MSLTKYILHSIYFYRKLNLTVVLGIALSTAILVGALIVGDSVKFSLQQIARQRLGKTSQVIAAGERIFNMQLATAVAKESGVPTSALLRSNGFAVLNGGAARINQLAIWGIDSLFCHFGNNPETLVLEGNQAAINEDLAKQFGLKVGDEFMLRVNKLNTFPANTPFVAQNENNVAFRIVVHKILSPDQLGNLNLRNIQSSPRNLFLNISWLNKQMGLHEKANVILVAEDNTGQEFTKILQKCWKIEDLNLQIRENSQLNYTEVISDRVFVEPAIEQFFTNKIPATKPVLSYFSNKLKANNLQTPYSFLSSDPDLKGHQIAVSQWLAEDLKLKLNDSVRVSYFAIGLQRQLTDKETTFRVKDIYQIEGPRADKNLMPLIPGLSDAGNCRDWKTGVPVDLKKIRPKDEAYWKKYSGIPKAFVSLETAKELWGNRFGKATAIRISGMDKVGLERMLLAGLSPTAVGFDVREVKEEGFVAASNGVDFGQLFIGLSFFVLFAAILLSYLLFRLFLNYRKSEIGTLFSLGFSASKIRTIFLAESSIYLIFGVLIGIPLAILYNHLILIAINTIWVDIVRTSIVHVQVSPISIIAGSLVIAFLTLGTIWMVISRFTKEQLVHLQRKSSLAKQKNGRWSATIGTLLIVFSFILLISKGFKSGEIDPELFFIGGFLLLPGLILLVDVWLRRLGIKKQTERFTTKAFYLSWLAGERSRQIQIIAFLASGIFMVMSTGLNRKDVTKNTGSPSSGTGGYRYLIETTIPVLSDPYTKKGREELDLPEGSKIVTFQVQPGDDASCLNLNKISRPRIIACNPRLFDQREAFSFTTRTSELDSQHPWLSLTRKLDDQVIPAIADQTAIQWGLGKKVGDTLVYKNEAGMSLRLKLIGGLENSVLQGNVVIADDLFAQQFPSVSGSSLFLLDLPDKKTDKEELLNSWRSWGPEITLTSDRLVNFYQIENTYLNIFLMLGALGLLIGTIGFGILIFRTTRERIPEFALLLSLGFQRSFIFRTLLWEKLLIILVAIGLGIIPAMLSALPTLLTASNTGLWLWIPAISLLVSLSGLLFSYLAVKLALRQNLVQAMRNE